MPVEAAEKVYIQPVCQFAAPIATPDSSEKIVGCKARENYIVYPDRNIPCLDPSMTDKICPRAMYFRGEIHMLTAGIEVDGIKETTKGKTFYYPPTEA